MGDTKPCFKCKKFKNVDDMKCCEFNFDAFCPNCDDELVMIRDHSNFRSYVHIGSLTRLQAAQPTQHWIKL